MTLTAHEEKNNARINDELRTLYDEYTQEFLSAWSEAFNEAPPCRMNEFSIIDISRYNANKGILFICRETNGWSDKDYENGCLFREWLCDISQNGIRGKGHVSRHPNMWYTIGRWALFIQDPKTPIKSLAYLKDEAIDILGTIAFTNLNKVRGKNKSGKEYYNLVNNNITKELIQKEVDILNPKIVVACGTGQQVTSLLSDHGCRVICMSHPAARKTQITMLQELRAQLV